MTTTPTRNPGLTVEGLTPAGLGSQAISASVPALRASQARAAGRRWTSWEEHLHRDPFDGILAAVAAAVAGIREEPER
jgi:hypothetical protein